MISKLAESVPHNPMLGLIFSFTLDQLTEMYLNISSLMMCISPTESRQTSTEGRVDTALHIKNSLLNDKNR